MTTPMRENRFRIISKDNVILSDLKRIQCTIKYEYIMLRILPFVINITNLCLCELLWMIKVLIFTSVPGLNNQM